MAKKSTLGSLLINLELQTATLNKQIAGMNKKFGGMTKTIKSVGVAMVGAFGAYSVISGLKQTAASLDAIAKTSDRLGIATDKLISFRHAAELSGVSVQTLEMAMQRMTRRVAQDAKTSTEALEAMGLSVEKFKNLTLDKQMEAVADGLKNVGTQSERVSIAFKLFDAEGVKVLNMLQNGSKGMREAEKEARALGLTVDRTTLSAVERANDEFYRMGLITEGLKTRLVAMSSTAMASITSELNKWAVSGGAERLWKGLLIVAEVGYRVGQVFSVTANILGKFFTQVYSGILKVAQIRASIFETYDGELNAILKMQDTLSSNTEQFNSNIKQSMDTLKKPIGNLIEKYMQISLAISKSTNVQNEFAESTADTSTKMEKLAVRIQDGAFVFTNAFSNMENSIVEFAKTGTFEFAKFAEAVLEDLLRMIIRLQITIPLINSMQAALGGTAGGSLFGFAQGGAISGGVQKFATGGVVNSPTMFPMKSGMGLMGEAGAEAIMPLKRTAGGDLGVNASGMGTVVNIYNESGSDAEVSESQDGNGKRIIDVMIRDSVKSSLGDGSLDRAFKTNFGLKRKGA